MKFIKSLIISLLFLLTLVAVPPVFAGTDLTIVCPNTGTCSISPTSTPLFNEVGWVPGSTVTQYIKMTNNTSQNGYSAIQVLNYEELKNLGEIVQIDIREGSPVGPVLYGGVTLHQFRDDGYFTFDAITAGQTVDYFLTAVMPYSAGNEYQAARVEFDLKMGLELVPIPPTSGGGDGGGGSVAGTSTSIASPPRCDASAPTTAPNVTITNVGTNTVSLSWTPVSPVTHYGITFTRTSDGAQYGSTNIGNVTSYTVTNLSGGANYTFQVFGVNDCAPGPLSNNAATGIVPGPFIASRPTGPGGEVLGVTTASPTPAASPGTQGEVKGAETAASCVQWRLYIPWILLIMQFFFILASEYYFRKDHRWTKHYLAIGITLASIFIFYLIRECQCYAGQSFLAWLCKWYWLVALLLTGLVKAVSYAFIEEVQDKESKPPTPKLTEKS